MSLLSQRNFAGGELSPALYARTDTNKYATGLRLCRNFMIQKHGGVTNRAGTKFIAEITASQARLIPFVVNAENSYVLVFSNLKVEIFRDDAKIQELVTPYTAADISQIQYVQSTDVMTLAHRNHPVKELKRTLSGGSFVFALANMSFTPKTPAPNVSGFSFASGPVGTISHTYVFTYINPITSEESLTSGELTGAYAKPDSANPVVISIPAHATYKEVVIYKKINGRFGYLATVGTGAQYRDIDATIYTSDSPPENKDILNKANEYPGVVSYFQQRLCFASTIKEPEKVWLSRTGRFNNFSSSSPIKSDDSISFTAAGRQINEVRHLVDAGALVMFTSGAEWIAAGSDSSALTPTSINLKQTSYNGSSRLPPLTVNGNVLYCQARGAVIRDLAYEMASDGYRGNDLTVFSSHLFEGRSLVDWAFQQTPNSIIWVVRDDGKVLGLTYIKEHLIFGWHQHDFGGVVKNVCSIPTESEDEIYFIIERNINGVTKLYLERLTSRWAESQDDMVMMDCAKSFTNPTASRDPQVISGLSHLEGEFVSVLGDGFVAANPNNKSYKKIKVEGGQITVDGTYKKVHVGLPYNSDLETLDIDMAQGTLIGRKKLVNKLHIFLERSRGVWLGPSEPDGNDPLRNLVELKLRENNEMKVTTGVADVTIGAGWSDGGRVFIRQTDPLPVTILSITHNALIPNP